MDVSVSTKRTNSWWESSKSNAAGIVTPLAIGVIVSATGSFVLALALISAVTLIGALSYIFVVGDLKRIEIDLPAALPATA